MGSETTSPGRRLLRGAAAALTVGCLVALAAVSSAGASPAREAPAPDYDAVRARTFVVDYAKRHGLPGASYVVVKDGEPVTEGATGSLEVDTPVSVGSLAKSFTAFAVLQLADGDAVDLDAPVTRYLDGFSVGGTDPGDITVRMLLSHTSGLPNPLLVPSTGDLAEDVANIADLDAESAPGTAYRYSNLNFRTLARLVEVVSGEGFDAYLERHVFGPLGMDRTRSVIAVSDVEGLDSGHVTAYGAALPMPELLGDVAGAGGVISTAHDMGLWLRMQQRGGTAPDGTRMLSARLVEQSHTVQAPARTYGFGWQKTTTADPARIGHDGSLTRYSSRMDLVPSSGYGVAVLLDSYTPTIQHPFSISTGLIDVSEGRSPEVGVPVATLIDLVLGAATVLLALLGLWGVVRSRRWIERRRSLATWKLLLRLTPQLVMPVVAGVLFLGLTGGSQNPATPRDAFGLWPSATTLVLVAGLVGVAVCTARTLRWARSDTGVRADRLEERAATG